MRTLVLTWLLVAGCSEAVPVARGLPGDACGAGPELCDDGIDNDCDGEIDEPACEPAPGEGLQPGWARLLGVGFTPRDMAIDGQGRIYLVGRLGGSFELGGDRFSGIGALVVSFDTQGNYRWARFFDGDPDLVDQADAVAVDAQERLYVAGWFRSNQIDFGGGPLSGSLDSYSEGFVASFRPDGTHRWSRALKGSVEDAALGAAVDAEGNVLVTGHFMADLTIGGRSLSSTDSARDVFVASYTPDGTLRWVAQGSGPDRDGRYIDVATGPGGEIRVGGTFREGIAFGEHELTSRGFADTFVSAWSPAGEAQWAARHGTAEDDDFGRELAVGPDGAAILFGERRTSQSSGNELVATSWQFGDGAPAWTLRGPRGLRDHFDVATDAAGHVHLTGSLGGTLELGDGQTLEPVQGGHSLFVASFTSGGSPRGSMALGTRAGGAAVDVGPEGHLYVVGEFDGEPISFADRTLEPNAVPTSLLLQIRRP